MSTEDMDQIGKINEDGVTRTSSVGVSPTGIAVDGSEKVSRRRLLAGGLVAAIGAIASAVLPRKARADDGDPLAIGAANSGTQETRLTAPATGEAATALVVDNNSVASQFSVPSGIRGEGYFGLEGVGKGRHTWEGPPPPDPTGVAGISRVPEDGRGRGVMGQVLAETEDGGFVERGVGVWGVSITEPIPPLAYDIGETDGMETPMGIGVFGMGIRRGVVGAGPEIGVFGRSPAVGVRGESPSGVALDVRGKAAFSRSGRGLIRAGRSYATVSCAGLAWNSMILVTLQGSAGSGRYVAYAARTSSSAFKVVLNAAATRGVYFAWFVIN